MTSTINCAYANAITVLYKQFIHKSFFIQCNRGTHAQGRHQSTLDLCTSSITTSMENAPTAMSSFTAQEKAIGSRMLRAIRLSTIKLDAHLYKPAHRIWSLLNKNTHRLLITQTSASSKSIRKMEFRAIIRSQRYRKTPLSITRITLTKLPLRKKGHTQMLRQSQGNREARNTTSNDSNIERLT